MTHFVFNSIPYGNNVNLHPSDNTVVNKDDNDKLVIDYTYRRAGDDVSKHYWSRMKLLYNLQQLPRLDSISIHGCPSAGLKTNTNKNKY